MSMSVRLTKDAQKSMAKIYKAYIDRRNNGESKDWARYFDKFNPSYEAFINEVKDDVRELKEAGLLNVSIHGGFEISFAGIVFMENQKADTIKEWLSFGAQFIP